MWQTKEDEHVRKSHRKANKQEVPVNLRFELDAVDRGIGEKTYMLFPRDESSRDLGNLINCRCTLILDQDGIAKYVKVTQAEAKGAKATATVYAEGDHVIGAEYGDVYSLGNVSEGTFFMERAAAEVQALYV
jgi:hypothetical protein